ncbi:SDR family NAD(P)-dependent oxidoreductase [Kutzneria sp. NPDC052558]|uniref:SDR family NAD(P)-dependent oxidoreductase n=1 Tax=Kutzneria sp. NPDC052558 TaxID=3364121 RepID=UPI0037C8D165
MENEAKLLDYLKRATADLRETRRRLRAAEHREHEPVAIIGMGCRFPGGVSTPEQLWRLVASGADAIGPFPTDRGWDLDGLRGTSDTGSGGFLYEAAGFDPAFFGISPREAVAMDPQQRLLLETSWEAVESARIDPTSLRGSATGVFAGVIYHDYAARIERAPQDVAGYLGNGSDGAIATGRVSYTMGLEGPAVTVDTACSSSLVAIDLAVRALRRGECSLVLAGGVTVMSTADTFVEFSRQGGLSRDGRCKAFGAGADGTGWGEGAGMLLLERLSDAERHGHRVLAVIRGSATNQDGASSGLTAPNGPSQQRVIRQALADAELEPSDVDVVEAHGTGTPLGDPIEAQALSAAYGRERETPLWLGSVKSNIGHTQGAAGVAGVIKMVLAMRHGVLPRTLHADQPSPHVDWLAGPVRPLIEQRDWPRGENPRRAGVSSFGVSGTNAHLILEEPPAVPPVPPRPAGVATPWVLSARSAAALRAKAGQLAGQVDAESIVDVGYSLAATRARMEHRAVVIGSDPDRLAAGLRALADDDVAGNVVRGVAGAGRRVAFVFPGHGTQWAGMAVELMADSPVFAEWMGRCAGALAPYADWKLEEVLHGVPGTPPLDRADVLQPVLWAVMVSLAQLWRSYGVEPEVVIGHSLGEIAAATVAGAFAIEDGARIVALRGQAIHRTLSGHGGMMVVPLPADEVRRRLDPFYGKVSVGALNGPRTTAVSGETAALASLRRQLAQDRIAAAMVKIDYASHSDQAVAVRERLLADLAPVRPATGELPLCSTVTGGMIDTAAMDAEYWYTNLLRPVRFEESVRALLADGIDAFVEVGPHPVLATAIQEIVEDAGATAVAVGSLRRGDGGLERLHRSMAQAYVQGVEVDWAGWLGRSDAVAVDLPTYPFQRRRFWLDAGDGDAHVSAAGLLPADHPLLGAAVVLADSGGVAFSGRVSLTTHPWLADHVAGGAVLFPGTAFVELATWAGGQFGCDTVDDLTVEAPLVLPRHAAVQLQVFVGATDGTHRPVTVHSRPADSDVDTPWTRHARGFVTQTVAEPDFDLSVWPPAGATPVDVTDLYDRLAAEGYGYGPAFQGVRAAWRRGDEIFAEVALPAAAGEPGAFGVHPALLDACLHAESLLADDNSGVRLPFAWQDVTRYAVGAADVRVHLRVTAPGAMSVRIADSAGTPVVSIGDLVSLPVTQQQLSASSGSAADALFRMDHVPARPERPESPIHFAVLGDNDLGLDADTHEDLHSIAGAGVGLVFAAVPGGGDAESAHLAAHRALELVWEWLGDERFPHTRLALVGDGSDPAVAAAFGLIRSAQSENPGRIVTVDADGPLPVDEVLAAAVSGEPALCVRAGAVSVPRLARASTSEALTVPAGVAHWRLDAVDKGDLDSLALVPHPAALAPLEPHQVRLSIRAAGLNFRDVVVSLGMVPDRDAAIGGEAAGVVLEVGSAVVDLVPGDRVMGLLDGAFGPVGVTDHLLLARIPDDWSFTLAASVPGVFLTAYHGLTQLAGVRAGESVLIHAGAGGVGMAAVQLARHLGAEVFATAAPGKWDVLRGLGLDDDHIASSRTLEFEAKFRGVDVVLNSLAGEFVDASLRLLSPGGRFVEMGKTDIRDAADLPGIRYAAFDLIDSGPEHIRGMFDELLELFETGVLSPLPVRAWDVRRAREAFRFMAGARHVGKIVLTMPPVLDPDGTVLITGGTGTLGRLVARHLVAVQGVRHLLLASRSGGDPDLVAELTELGATVTVVGCDVSDRRALVGLLAGVPDEHPLTGIVHTAGVLDDALVGSLTVDRIDTVFRPKVDAAWHLHELTRDLDLGLFVLYSSAAGVLGSAGQGSYAAANAFLDGLATHRRSLGLAASSIAWGFWEERSGMTGHVSDAEVERMVRTGLLPLSSQRGMELFDAAVAMDEPMLVALPLDMAALREEGDRLPAALRGFGRAPVRRAVAAGAVSGPTVEDQLGGLTAPEQKDLLERLVRAHAAAVLGHADADAVDPGRAFREAGFDSLTALELRNRLNAATGLRLPASMVFDHPTPTALAGHLLAELAPAAADPIAPVLAEIDRLETALAGVTGADADPGRITARLQTLLRRWSDTHTATVPDQGRDLTTASDEEIFAALDNELGIS